MFHTLKAGSVHILSGVFLALFLNGTAHDGSVIGIQICWVMPQGGTAQETLAKTG